MVALVELSYDRQTSNVKQVFLEYELGADRSKIWKCQKLQVLLVILFEKENSQRKKQEDQSEKGTLYSVARGMNRRPTHAPHKAGRKSCHFANSPFRRCYSVN